MSVVAYQTEWVDGFEAEREVLERTLAPWLRDGIHHVGSTAVPGLSAKPVIDMIGGVKNLMASRAAIASLARLDYRFAPHRPEAHWFLKPGGAEISKRTHHLHLTEAGSAIWRERLAFRDALRADAALAAEYEALKLALAEEHGTEAPEYTAGKRPFVARVLAAAGIDL